MTFKKNHLRLLFLLIPFLILAGIHFWSRSSLNRDVSLYTSGPGLRPQIRRTSAVRIDPSYYYDGRRPAELAEALARQWNESGINLVYFRAYDPDYGAFYRSSYRYNREGEFGRYDLLKQVLKQCRQRDIRVSAWLPVMNHRGAWEAHPEWREQTQTGEDYQATGLEYPLCFRNPEARNWWLGFIRDLLEHYPELDGVDLAEPVVSWKAGDACYCELCREAYSASSEPGEIIRAQPLTKLLQQSLAQIHAGGFSGSITFVAVAGPEGDLRSHSEVRHITGFDLPAILDGRPDEMPDSICPEFIWQEWKSRYSGKIFIPDWSGRACRQLAGSITSPVPIIAHVEATDFTGAQISPKELEATLKSVLRAGAQGTDVYSSHLVDSKQAWPVLAEAAAFVPEKNCLILYDPAGDRNDALQTGELLRHFHVRVELKSVSEYESGLLHKYDNTFYIGTEQGTSIPPALTRDLTKLKTTFCWTGFNIGAVLDNQALSHRLGLIYRESVQDTYTRVRYKETNLVKPASWANVVEVTDLNRNQILATAHSDSGDSIPYALRSGRNFWFIADIPSAYAVEGGRFLVFADLLHDILNEDHVPSTTAMVRIEDVHPLTDPASLKKIAAFLHRQKVPFQVAFTPVYVYPEDNQRVTLSERTQLVDALKEMVRKGGTLVLHGITHQRFRETTTDYEFWDPVQDAPVEGQTKPRLRDRIDRGLRECWRNHLFPLIWETPHYAASQEFYQVISDVFSLAMERRQTIDRRGTDQYLPYILFPDRFGQIVLPENLGYVPLSDPKTEIILEPARKMKVVRDGVASFFFHPFVDLDVLKSIVKTMQREGFLFTNAAGLPIQVRSASGLISNQPGPVDFSPLVPNGKKIHLLFPGIPTQQQAFSAAALRSGFAFPRMNKKELYGFHFLSEPDVTAARDKPPQSRLLRQASNFQGEPAQVPVALLLDNPEAGGAWRRDILSYASVFHGAGIHVDIQNTTDFSTVPAHINLLIIPEASAGILTEMQIPVILQALENGRLSVITGGASLLADELNIQTGEEDMIVFSPEDIFYPGVDITWNPPRPCPVFEAPETAEFIYRDHETGNPLMVSAPYGKGRFLYLGPHFDGETPEGESRFPHFLTHVFRSLNVFPLLRGWGAEVFFNPAEREDIAVEDLIRAWRMSGIRVIHAAAWQVFPEWSYDYSRLIHLAHNNAMQVYAWIEPPFVHDKFWQDHPEFREKNALGEDADFTWRLPAAMGEPSARAAALREWQRLLTEYNWDGVTINHLGFNSRWPLAPETATPFSASVRRGFLEQNGFDPVELFKPSSSHYHPAHQKDLKKYLEYRQSLSREYLEELLNMLAELSSNRSEEREILISYDARRPDPGIDLSGIEELNDDYSLTWQYIPQESEGWIPPESLFDALQVRINPVSSSKPFAPAAPTCYPTGTGLYNRLLFLKNQGQRFILFSESSLYEVDAHMLPFLYSSGHHQTWSSDSVLIHSPHSGEIVFSNRKIKSISVNGRMSANFSKKHFLVPAGHISLSPKESGASRLLRSLKSRARVVDFSGDILKTRTGWRGLAVEYRSEKNAYLVINQMPSVIRINGKKSNIQLEKGLKGWTLPVPAGHNRTEIITRSRSGLVIEIASLAMSNVIVLISTLAILFMVVIFIVIHFRRRKAGKK
jgi:uncharacterized protein YdaL